MKSFLFCLILFSLSSHVSAQNTGTNVKRKILAIWDSSEFDGYENIDYTASNIHKKVEVIFNHYGYVLEYVDIHKVKPSFFNKNLNNDIFGIITWFSDNKMKYPLRYSRWLGKQYKRGKKTIIFGFFGFLNDLKDNVTDLAKVNRNLLPFQLRIEDAFHSNPFVLKAEIKVDPSLVEFETILKDSMRSLQEMHYMGPEKDIWVYTKITHENKAIPSVIASNKFVYVHQDYVVKLNTVKFLTKWKINPFEVLKKVLKTNFPIPDTTTLFGKRVLYNHIDGDGYINISYIDRKSYSGKIIVEKIFKKYTYPTSASVIVAEVDSKYLGDKVVEDQIKEMYTLPHIEVASHTYTHPLSWNVVPLKRELEIYNKPDNYRDSILGYDIGYKKINYNLEIHKSIKHINKKYAPANKKTKLLLWSGSCHPPTKALKVIDKYKYLNINGGDPMFTKASPSYSHLSPLLRKVGPYTQVYSSSANENIYTNLWRGPFGGYSKLIEHMTNTGSPIRIKPMNVYYHFYSGERKAALKALEDIYTWIDQQESHPIFTSEFAKMILDFNDIKIKEISPRSYYISGLKHLKTLRLENTNLLPDYKRSKNIMGHRIENDIIYIHVGKEDNVTLHLNSKESKIAKAYIVSSNNKINQLVENKNEIIIDYNHYVPLRYKIYNPQNKKVKIIKREVL